VLPLCLLMLHVCCACISTWNAFSTGVLHFQLSADAPSIVSSQSTTSLDDLFSLTLCFALAVSCTRSLRHCPLRPCTGPRTGVFYALGRLPYTPTAAPACDDAVELTIGEPVSSQLWSNTCPSQRYTFNAFGGDTFVIAALYTGYFPAIIRFVTVSDHLSGTVLAELRGGTHSAQLHIPYTGTYTVVVSATPTAAVNCSFVLVVRNRTLVAPATPLTPSVWSGAAFPGFAERVDFSFTHEEGATLRVDPFESGGW
jgi:hypothetical protein